MKTVSKTSQGKRALYKVDAGKLWYRYRRPRAHRTQGYTGRKLPNPQ